MWNLSHERDLAPVADGHARQGVGPAVDKSECEAIEDGTNALGHGTVFLNLLEQGTEATARLSCDDRTWLQKDIGKATAGWEHCCVCPSKGYFDRRTAPSGRRSTIHTGDDSPAPSVSHWPSPSLLRIRLDLLDGLLARAKVLLRDHHSVRARIKQTYRAILVDEFQDTDPVQYEIMLYLAEDQGSMKTSWDELELEPGKLFIVRISNNPSTRSAGPTLRHLSGCSKRLYTAAVSPTH